MKPTLIVMSVLALGAAGAAVAYQAAARDRDYQALVARGDAALRDQQTFGAIEAYSGAIALRPDSMLAHLRRAETYERRGDRGDLDQAARDFRRAAALDPTATRPLEELGDVLYQVKRYQQAAQTYAAFLRLDDRSARVSYKLALASYASRDIETTIATVNQTLRLNDRLPDVYYLLGMALREKRNQKDAIRAFERAVQLSPGSIPAREELADLYNATGRHAEELEQLQVLAAIDRDHVERRVAVGLAQARRGHPELAVATLRSALEGAAEEPLVYAALGQIWLELAQARNDSVDRSKALEALSRVASSPTATSAMLTLCGRALLLDNQNERAEYVLQQAASRYPVEPTSLFWYATAAERQGHLATARNALLEYGELVGEDVDLAARAARIAAMSMKLNDPSTAVDWLSRAVDLAPADLRLLTSLAEAQLKLGDRESAQASIARGLEKDPDNRALLLLARRVR